MLFITFISMALTGLTALAQASPAPRPSLAPAFQCDAFIE